ncbi:MAG: glycoside hydrolase family 97 protein [Oscillospiraceae bacterium]|jgi:hypothetical protein|nr:glycoside hydrolase family 97 protein [Oscillospiraceae bacterium]
MRHGVRKAAALALSLVMALGVFSPGATAVAAPSWTVSSPDGAVVLTLGLSDAGVLSYAAAISGREVLPSAAMGLNVTGYEDFSSGLTFVSASAAVEIDETYPMYSGKASEYTNHAFERTFNFIKNGKPFAVIARAYDDGAAFRYALDGDGSYAMAAENTSIALPSGATIYGQTYRNEYEGLYGTYTPAAMTAGGGYCMPLLIRTAANDWALFAQAELNGTYAGTKLVPSGTSGLLDFAYANGAPIIDLPFQSPWRLTVIGDTKAIFETQMFENLCAASVVEDAADWVKPGVTSWSWLSTGTSSMGDGDLQMRFLDLAAEMNWEYTLLDHNWWNHSAQTFPSWADNLFASAAERGVGVWVWEDVANLNTHAKRSERFDKWAAKGIVGVKVDYMYSEAQSMLKIYDDIYEDALAYGFMLNFHGSNLPGGERRTYPHVVAREGVLGAEHGGSVTAAYNTMLPFIRNVTGPMDYTPSLQTRVSGKYTYTHGVALSVVYECGASTNGDTPVVYRNSGAYNFLKGIPSAWDESKLVSGVPGQHVIVARRSGENWYVGAITAAARTETLALDFLDDDVTYYASIFTDATSTTTTGQYFVPVTRESIISLPMLTGGGAAVKLTKTSPVSLDAISLSDKVVTLMAGSSKSVGVTYEPTDADAIAAAAWASADPAVATVANGMITAVAEGNTTVTVMVGDLTASVLVSVYPNFKRGTMWRVVGETGKTYLSAPNQVTTMLEPADIWKDRASGTNVYLTDAPDGDFDVTVALKALLFSAVQSAGLIAWVDKDHYVSVVRRFHNTYGGQCFAVISERSSSEAYEPAISDKELYERYGEEYADTDNVFLRMVKAGNNFAGYVSMDGVNWRLIAEQTNAPVGGSSALSIGLFNTGDTPTEVKYTDFTVNGDAILFTANQDQMPYVRNPVWRVDSETPAYLVGVAPSRLELQTQAGDMWNAGTSARNVWNVLGEGNADFDTRVKLTYTPTGNYHTAALIAYVDQNNYVAVSRFYDTRRVAEVGSANAFKVTTEVNGTGATQDDASLGTTKGYVSGADVDATCWLRLVKVGTSFTGYFSETGEDGTWTLVRAAVTNAIGANANLKLGIYTASGGTGAAAISAVFEDFTLDDAVVPFMIPDESGGETVGFAKSIVTTGEYATAGATFGTYAYLRGEGAASVILAAYDVNGKLTALSSLPNVALTNTLSRAALSITPPSAGVVKLFIWDSDSYTPLTCHTVWEVK